MPIEPFDLLVREIQLHFSYINPFTQTRAAELIASGRVAVEPLISRSIPLGEAVEAIANPARRGRGEGRRDPGRLRTKETPMPHPALVPDAVAVVTGGASGIGLAAASAFAAAGLRVCIADLGAERLAAAAERIAAAAPAGAAAVMAVETDVADFDQVQALAAAVAERWGGTDVLMNNAGIGPASGVFGPADVWARTLAGEPRRA